MTLVWHSVGAEAQVRSIILGIYLATEKQSRYANRISFFCRVMSVTGKAKSTARLNLDYQESFDLEPKYHSN